MFILLGIPGLRVFRSHWIVKMSNDRVAGEIGTRKKKPENLTSDGVQEEIRSGQDFGGGGGEYTNICIYA